MSQVTNTQKVWFGALGLWLIALWAAFLPESPAPQPAKVPAPPAPAMAPVAVMPISPKDTPPLIQAAPPPAPNPLEPAWVVDPSFKNGLEADILAMRAKREIQPREGFLHEEEVTFAGYEDVTGVNLEDGRSMLLGKGNVERAVAIAWKPGTKLLLGYSERDGVLLIEPANGAVFMVDYFFGDHPLDHYQKAMEKQVVSTVDTIALSNDMHRLWGLEADRCVREVLENPHAPQWVKENLVRLTHARKSFDDAYNRHVGACLEAFYGGGTMRSWDHSEIGKNEDRRFAQQLLEVRYQARFFKPPEKPEEGK